MKEIWKNILDFDGYQVSNLGKIKSLERFTDDGHHIKEKILKQSFTKGYLKVNLCRNGLRKTIYVHKLVAEAFLSNPNNLFEINHKDENKLNNRADNLEWCTHKYNIHYGTAIKRMSIKQMNNKKSKPVKMYDESNKFICIYPSIMEAYRKTGTRPTNIIQCCKGLRKTAGKHKWEYVKE